MFRHEKSCVCFVTYFRGRVYTMQDSLQTGDMFLLIYIPLRHLSGSRLACVAGKQENRV